MSKIGFGLHKDKDWEEVPNDYLIWAEQNFKGNSLTLVQAELEKRKNFDLLLNDLFTDPRIQKILAEKKKIGVLGT